MNLEENETAKLFSYGTLQIEDVQRSTFGRKLEGEPDTLVGYRLTQIPIRDPEVVAKSGETHYRNIQFTGFPADVIEGTVFMLTGKELEQADIYEEDADYRRLQVLLKSGTTAWVYLYVDRAS